ncbi:MAG: hypothetical protein PHR82_06440 [Endomicrobiaceae bacterium]|nr:hypothetical protein [Endomicrobiaceae bacterium]
MNTTFTVIQTRFHSMPMTKYVISESLEKEWLKTAVADFELELSCELGYDEENCVFSSQLDGTVIRTLALMMYTSYLQRENSRVMALNGIYGKDITITGADGTKKYTKQELDSELARVQELLHKQKQNCFG